MIAWLFVVGFIGMKKIILIAGLSLFVPSAWAAECDQITSQLGYEQCIKTVLSNLENRSTELEDLWEKNESDNDDLQKKLNVEREALGGVLFVTQQLAGTTKTRFENSLTTIQFPDRILFLDELIKKLSYKRNRTKLW